MRCTLCPFGSPYNDTVADFLASSHVIQKLGHMSKLKWFHRLGLMIFEISYTISSPPNSCYKRWLADY